MNVGSAVEHVVVTIIKADVNAVKSGSVTAGTEIATGQAAIPLSGAETKTNLSITVTASNGSSNTYTIIVQGTIPVPSR